MIELLPGLAPPGEPHVAPLGLETLTPARPLMEVPGELRVAIPRHEMDKV